MKRLKILSLFWHSVESDSINPEYLDGSSPTSSMFREHIKYIVNKYTPISIFDFMKITKNRKLIRSYVKPPVLLGFDDGFKNVLDNALPILNEFKVPAMFFVIGEILKNPDFVPWYIERKHLFRTTKKKTFIYDNARIDMTTRQGRELLENLISTAFKECRLEEDRQKLFVNLANLLDIKRPVASELDDDLCFVNNEDLANLSSTSQLTVVSHAMTHRCLESLTYEEQVYELEQSDLLLSENCPSYYRSFSYPDGSFNADTITIAKRMYESAFAVYRGSYCNLYAYPRMCIGHCTVKELAYCISSTRINYIKPIKRLLHNIGVRRMF